MTTRYVGKGGSDSNNGLSWANRKLTLNGVEDTPIVAGDTVYVGPGTYRELLTMDVTGTDSSHIITYIADISGANTDGIGGLVRLTGSDNDQTVTRSTLITGGTMSYRTFRGFYCDIYNYGIRVTTQADNIVIEDCIFAPSVGGFYQSVDLYFVTNSTVRRCMFMGTRNSSNGYGVWFQYNAGYTGSNLVEDCIFTSLNSGVRNYYSRGNTIKNCLFMGCHYGIANDTIGTATKTLVYNCIITACSSGLWSNPAESSYTENYNSFFGNYTNRSTSVSVGANSNAYPASFVPKLLSQGIDIPWDIFHLSPWSQIKTITGTSEATEDLFGLSRPATSGKKSRGPIQYSDIIHDAVTKRTGYKSMKFEDAGRRQIIVPCTAISTTVSIYCNRGASYAGTNPQIVIKQPGQSDRTTTSGSAAETWEQLTDTFTPASSPSFFVVELVSNNTNTANPTANDVFFDDLTISKAPNTGSFEQQIVDRPFREAMSKLDRGGFEYWITDRINYKTYVKLMVNASTSKHAYLDGDSLALIPVSDLTVGSWMNESSSTPLYSSLADESDSTYAWFHHAMPNDYFEVGLTSISGVVSGIHVLSWRATRKAGAQVMVLKCELRDGSTVIVSSEQTLSDSEVHEFNHTLTAGEIASISGYTDLRIRVTVVSVT